MRQSSPASCLWTKDEHDQARDTRHVTHRRSLLCVVATRLARRDGSVATSPSRRLFCRTASALHFVCFRNLSASIGRRATACLLVYLSNGRLHTTRPLDYDGDRRNLSPQIHPHNDLPRIKTAVKVMGWSGRHASRPAPLLSQSCNTWE
jgi:hypothetical protein